MEEKLSLNIRQMIQLHQVSLVTSKTTNIIAIVRFVETYRCVKGQGMLNMRTHDTGDLIIQFDVDFPSEKALTEDQLKVIVYLISFPKHRKSFLFFSFHSFSN